MNTLPEDTSKTDMFALPEGYTPQHLTLEGVKEAATKAYNENRLTAQAVSVINRQCIYRTDGVSGATGCAIGVALNESTLDLIEQLGLNAMAGVGRLASKGLITFSNEDASGIYLIQREHDAWCRCADNDLREFAEGRFRSAIGLPAR